MQTASVCSFFDVAGDRATRRIEKRQKVDWMTKHCSTEEGLSKIRTNMGWLTWLQQIMLSGQKELTQVNFETFCYKLKTVQESVWSCTFLKGRKNCFQNQAIREEQKTESTSDK